jgi:GNAT superfamily N-acetyltransferase
MEVSFSDYLISTDRTRLDQKTIFRFLSQSYWANTRPFEQIVASIDNSICFGVYHGERQIGFARIVTDRATMYWLCDVYIDEEYRGKGIGKNLIKTIVEFEELRGLFGVLGTTDAHGLYEQFGFVRNPDRAMIRMAI